MRLTGDPAPGTMNSGGSGSGNFLLVPIPEYPLLDCVPNKTVKIVVLGASNVGKTGMDAWRESMCIRKENERMQLDEGSFDTEIQLLACRGFSGGMLGVPTR